MGESESGGSRVEKGVGIVDGGRVGSVEDTNP